MKNKELNKHLALLTERAFQLYASMLVPSDEWSDSYFFMALYKLEPQIQQMEEFNRCVEVMNSTPQIKELFGKLVGTVGGSGLVEDAEKCILSFLYQAYSSTLPPVSNYSFEERYLAFEEFFYADYLRFKEVVRLYNFQSNTPEIALSENVRIKKSKELLSNSIELGSGSKVSPNLMPDSRDFRDFFVIEREIQRKKIVTHQDDEKTKITTSDWDKIAEELNEPLVFFDLVIKAIKVLKNSSVYRADPITTHPLTFQPQAGIGIRSSYSERRVFGEKCNISTDEVEKLKRIFEKLKSELNKHPTLKTSVNRLHFGMERNSNEDTVIDYMIALEALYLPNERLELRNKIATRIGVMLGGIFPNNKELADFVMGMYDKRSVVVHGATSRKEKNKLTDDDLLRLEDILRQSIRLFLDNPQDFSSETLGEIVFK